ncbi:MAG: hypothetical protein WCG19_04640 [Chlorobiaceae bacterium]
MKKVKSATPDFMNKVEEQQFCSTHDFTDYVDWGKKPKPPKDRLETTIN